MGKMTKKEAGRLGGQAWSLAKANASRVNGKLGAAHGIKGGRKRTRSLAQVLRRNDEALKVAYFNLTPHQRGKLARYWALWKHDWEVNFCMLAKPPASKATAAVRAALRELTRLARTTK